jgi:hypothetical protein
LDLIRQDSGSSRRTATTTTTTATTTPRPSKTTPKNVSGGKHSNIVSIQAAAAVNSLSQIPTTSSFKSSTSSIPTNIVNGFDYDINMENIIVDDYTSLISLDPILHVDLAGRFPIQSIRGNNSIIPVFNNLVPISLK